jgi:hypothetical protein
MSSVRCLFIENELNLVLGRRVVSEVLLNYQDEIDFHCQSLLLDDYEGWVHTAQFHLHKQNNWYRAWMYCKEMMKYNDKICGPSHNHVNEYSKY